MFLKSRHNKKLLLRTTLLLLLFLFTVSLRNKYLDKEKLPQSINQIPLITISSSDTITLEIKNISLVFSSLDFKNAVIALYPEYKSGWIMEERKNLITDINNKLKNKKVIKYQLDSKHSLRSLALEYASVDLLNAGRVKIYNNQTHEYMTSILAKITDTDIKNSTTYLLNDNTIIYEVIFWMK